MDTVHHKHSLGLGRSKLLFTVGPCSKPKNSLTANTTSSKPNQFQNPGQTKQDTLFNQDGHDGQPQTELNNDFLPQLNMENRGGALDGGF